MYIYYLFFFFYLGKVGSNLSLIYLLATTIVFINLDTLTNLECILSILLVHGTTKIHTGPQIISQFSSSQP